MSRKLLFSLLAVLVLMCGCGGGRKMYEGDAGTASSAPQATAPAAAPAADYDMAVSEEAFDDIYNESETSSGETSTETQKIIRNASLNMSTDRFTEVSEQIRAVAHENDGFVQESQQSSNYGGGRWLNITLRIPGDKYELALNRLKSLCVVNEATEHQENATAQYYDIKSRLDTKLIEEERLLELIDKTHTVEDILKLEELLGQVRTQIEVYQTQITSIDRLAAYSTITVYLYEVADETAVIVPQNLPDKVYASFIKSINSTIKFFQNVIILLAGLSAPLFVALVAIGIIWGMFKLKRKKL